MFLATALLALGAACGSSTSPPNKQADAVAPPGPEAGPDAPQAGPDAPERDVPAVFPDGPTREASLDAAVADAPVDAGMDAATVADPGDGGASEAGAGTTGNCCCRPGTICGFRCPEPSKACCLVRTTVECVSNGGMAGPVCASGPGGNCQ